MAVNGWSQAVVAAQVGVTVVTVNRWLNGHARPHQAQVRQIDRLFRDYVGILPVDADEIASLLSAVDARKKKYPNIVEIIGKGKAAESFLLELTYNSDAIEGSTLTKKQTEAIIFDRAVVKDKDLIEHLEAVNHAALLRDIFSREIAGPVDENMIRRIHKALMQGIRADAGSYSKYERGIRGVDLMLPHPDDVPEEMARLCAKINACDDHPVAHVARMHADFEAIHPFGDGNGRVGRLIMIIQLLNCGCAPAVISVNDKAAYYEYLEYAQRRSETHFIRFVAQAVLKGYDLLERTMTPL